MGWNAQSWYDIPFVRGVSSRSFEQGFKSIMIADYIRVFSATVCAVAGVFAGATAVQAAEPLELRVYTVRQEPVDNATLYRGGTAANPGPAIGTTGETGTLEFEAEVGETFVVSTGWSAPQRIEIAASDVARGYVAPILYNGAQVSSRLTGQVPSGSKRATIEFADPWLLGEALETEVGEDGRFRFQQLPSGLAFLTATVETGGFVRRVERAIRVGPGGMRNYVLMFQAGSATVEGRVYDIDGNPVTASILGQIWVSRIGEGFRVETDSLGRFSAGPLPVDSATIRAELDDGTIKRVDTELVEDESTAVEIRFGRGATIECSIEGAPSNVPVDVLVVDDHYREITHPTPRHADMYLEVARVARRDVDASRITLHGVPDGKFTVFAQTRVPGIPSDRVLVVASSITTIEVEDGAPPDPVTLRFRNSE